MKDDMVAALADIDKAGKAGGGKLLRAARPITKNCRQYTDELFVEVKDCFGNVVEIMRDNNIEVGALMERNAHTETDRKNENNK